MTTISRNGDGLMTALDGTWPLRPFHPDGFVGTLQADGQQVRVSALACDEERVVVLSLVGFDTSIGVVLSRLWSSTAVPFAPASSMPEMQEQACATTAGQEQAPSKQSKPPVWVPRYVLGNWDESGPHLQSFLGHLYALRVLFLHRDEKHPEWPGQWAEELWQRGLENRLITSLPAIGMRAWKLSGDLVAWSALVGEGVRENWLPWKEPEMH